MFYDIIHKNIRQAAQWLQYAIIYTVAFKVAINVYIPVVIIWFMTSSSMEI